MAKKDEKNALSDIFRTTEKPAKKAKKTNLIKPTTFGLSELEIAALQEIADDIGIARNAVGRYAIQYFLKQYETGEAELNIVKVPKLKAPK